MAEARAAAEARAPGRIRFLEAKAQAASLPRDEHDVAAVVGATHAFGGTAATLAALTATTRAGGTVVLGDGFWRRPPDVEGLAAIGATRDELTSLVELVAAVEAAGLETIREYVVVGTGGL